MAFPVVQGRQTGISTDTASRTVPLPAGVSGGELLIAGISSGLGQDELSWSAPNWLKLLELTIADALNPSLSSVSLAVFCRFATGADTLVVDNTGIGIDAQSVAYRIRGGSTPVGEIAYIPAGNLDPPSLLPGMGSREFLWLTFGAAGFPESASRSINTAPSGFSNLVTASQLESPGSPFKYTLAGSERAFAASSLDPSRFGYSSSSQTVQADSVTATVAIPPLPASGFLGLSRS